MTTASTSDDVAAHSGKVDRYVRVRVRVRVHECALPVDTCLNSTMMQLEPVHSFGGGAGGGAGGAGGAGGGGTFEMP